MFLRAIVCCIALLNLTATASYGAVANVRVSPFSGDWDWEGRPLKGRIGSFWIGRETVGPDGTPKTSPAFTHEFRHAPDGTREERVGKRLSVFCDAQGRQSKIVHTFTLGGTGVAVTATETATRAPDGLIERIDIRRTDGQDQSVEIVNERTPDGGRTATWEYQADDRTHYAALRYDAEGRLTEIASGVPGDPLNQPPHRITHNAQGDIATFTWGHSTDSYEYEYDAVGNWVRRARFMEGRAGERVPAEVEVRSFEYLPGKGGALAASAGKKGGGTKRTETTGGGRAAKGRSLKDLNGRYQVTRGNAGEPFVATMTIELLEGRAARYSITTEAPPGRGGRTEKHAEGSWTLADDILTIRLEKSHDGRPIPRNQQVLRLRVSADSRSLTMDHDAQTVFRRDGSADGQGPDSSDKGTRAAVPATPPTPAPPGDGFD